MEGMFYVYKVGDKRYFEIFELFFGWDIMVIICMLKIFIGVGYGGE